jgi:hypothetical protein
VWGASVSAQQIQGDLGISAVGADSASATALGSFATQVEWVNGTVAGSVGGAAAALDSGQFSGHGFADLWTVLGPARQARGPGIAFGASLMGSTHSSGFRTAAFQADARWQYARRSGGWWLGMTGAVGGSTVLTTAAAWTPSIGGWIRTGAATVSASFAPTWITGFWFPESEVQWSTSISRADAWAFAGWRGAPAASGVRTSRWSGGGGMTFWLSPRIGLAVSGGSYLSDLVQGLPAGRYFSLALRVANHRRLLPGIGIARETILLARPGDNQLSFVVRNATTVEIAGDWTAWQPVALSRVGKDRWALGVRLEGGIHRFNLVVDGQRWIVPDGYSAVDDGFGGKTALLVVPE